MNAALYIERIRPAFKNNANPADFYGEFRGRKKLQQKLSFYRLKSLANRRQIELQFPTPTESLHCSKIVGILQAFLRLT